MKALRSLLLVLTAVAGLTGAGTASAGLVRNTFYDCGVDITCASTAGVIVQFVSDDFMRAPAVPPAGQFTPRDPVNVTQQLAGSFSALSIETFNTNNAIGGLFIFDNLAAANGLTFSPVMAIGAATRAALRLDWLEGTYLGLGYVNCFNVSCSAQTAIRGFSKLVVDVVQTGGNTVPEPQSLALVLAALAAGVGVRRQRRAARA
jgi:hypothetical protein